VAATKRSNNLVILIGVATAVVGAVLVALLLAGRDSNSSAKAGSAGATDQVPVLVAKKGIAKGTAGADMVDSVEVRQVAALARSSDALVSLAELQDRTATQDIGADQQLRSSMFRQRTLRGDSLTIPAGKQAVAISVPFTAAGAGYVGPGDHVNVYALATKQGTTLAPACGTGLCPVGPNQPTASSQLVLANVEVLDVSQEVAPTAVTTVQPQGGAVSRATAGGGNVTYLLALDANQAEKAIFFTRYADVYLTLVPKGQPDSSTSGRDQTSALKP
jgi:Flp pilus assembly protein CpaB